MDVRVEFGDSTLNRGRIIRIFADGANALLWSIQLHFAADQKQIVTSYLAGL